MKGWSAENLVYIFPVSAFIWFNLSDPSEKDWMIIELQGFLESNETSGFNGLPIGDLHFDDKVGFYSNNQYNYLIYNEFKRIQFTLSIHLQKLGR